MPVDGVQSLSIALRQLVNGANATVQQNLANLERGIGRFRTVEGQAGEPEAGLSGVAFDVPTDLANVSDVDSR